MNAPPPPHPPPPDLPKDWHWAARFDSNYQRYYFVNEHTKQSTWEVPTGPAPNPSAEAPPQGPPPEYAGSGPEHTGNEKFNPNNPYNQSAQNPAQDIDEDARLAKQLQDEENRKAGIAATGERGANSEFYNSANNFGGGSSSQPVSAQYAAANNPVHAYPQDDGQRDHAGRKKGFLGKLFGGSSSHGSSSHYNQPVAAPGYAQQGYGTPGYGGPGYGQPQYSPQGGYGGGYPPQAAGYGQPQPGYGPGYPGYNSPPPRKSGGIGGAGMLGAGALGLGGGLVGGMLIADAMEDHDQGEYQQGYDDGAGYGADGFGDGGGGGGEAFD